MRTISRQKSGQIVVASIVVCLAGLVVAFDSPLRQSEPPGPEQPALEPAPVAFVSNAAPDIGEPQAGDVDVKPREISPFLRKGIEWLVKAQHKDGGWGAGSHAEQQNRDAHNVQVDPATTAFVAMALLRAGHTPAEGPYKDNVRRATAYLVDAVEGYGKSGPKITDLTGTQPQAKLGPLVDTSMTAQYLARVLTVLPANDPLRSRVDASLDKCLARLQESQQADGSWNVGGGWASVLQSSLGCSALELAQVAGKEVAPARLARARDYQQGNYNQQTGQVDASKAAGVRLYAFSGSQRGGAGQARAANDLIDRAKREGTLAKDAPVNAANLQKAGCPAESAGRLASANSAYYAQARQLADRDEGEALLRGFGSNGGEEFLSYLLTSESLIIVGGKEWDEWNTKMHARLEKIQSPDGSWSGHHCITSPVFCTAAVVQCLTTDRDAPTLVRIAQQAAKTTQADPKPQSVPEQQPLPETQGGPAQKRG